MSLKVTSWEKKSNGKGTGLFVVSSEGSLDTNTYHILEKEVDMILDASPSWMVFDLKKLDYISSMGVRVIAKAKKFFKKREGSVVLLNPQPQIRKVFEIVEALPSEQIFESVEEMDRYLDNIQKQEKKYTLKKVISYFKR
jgi:anti-anti-sigma factor